MKVVVITNDELKEELAACPFNDALQVEWIKNIADWKTSAADACIDLLFEPVPERIASLNSLPASLIIVNAVTNTLKDIGENFLRINGWPSFLKRPVAEAACTDDSLKQKAEELFSFLGRKTEWTPDIPGFITPRIVASIINEAFLALEEKISTETEIDIAMKQGTNYPYGPFEWSEIIGVKNICLLLETLSVRQERYRPAGLLKQKAMI